GDFPKRYADIGVVGVGEIDLAARRQRRAGNGLSGHGRLLAVSGVERPDQQRVEKRGVDTAGAELFPTPILVGSGSTGLRLRISAPGSKANGAPREWARLSGRVARQGNPRRRPWMN